MQDFTPAWNLAMLFFHGGFGPAWLYGIVALLALMSDVAIAYGVVFLITRWKVLTVDLRAVLAVVPLLALAAAAVFGWVATLPFGLFGGLPALVFFDASGFWTYVFLIIGGCLLNALGMVGIFGFIFNRLGRTKRFR